MDHPCPFCHVTIDPEVYDYVTRRAAKVCGCDERVRVRCPHCTETVVIHYDGTLIDPDAAANALADSEDDERLYGPANRPSDYGE